MIGSGTGRGRLKRIGSLIACRKPQWYVMLCEAVLESIGRAVRPEAVWSSAASKSSLVRWSVHKLANRPIIHGEVFSHGRFRNQTSKPSSKRDEDLNLFAWTRV